MESKEKSMVTFDMLCNWSQRPDLSDSLMWVTLLIFRNSENGKRVNEIAEMIIGWMDADLKEEEIVEKLKQLDEYPTYSQMKHLEKEANPPFRFSSTIKYERNSRFLSHAPKYKNDSVPTGGNHTMMIRPSPSYAVINIIHQDTFYCLS